MSGHTKGWTLSCEPLDYLDGIQSGLVVRSDNGVPVAYMFDHQQALVATAAPDLLEALEKSAEGWTNALELGIILPQHRHAATILRDEARAALDKARATEAQP